MKTKIKTLQDNMCRCFVIALMNWSWRCIFIAAIYELRGEVGDQHKILQQSFPQNDSFNTCFKKVS